MSFNRFLSSIFINFYLLFSNINCESSGQKVKCALSKKLRMCHRNISQKYFYEIEYIFFIIIYSFSVCIFQHSLRVYRNISQKYFYENEYIFSVLVIRFLYFPILIERQKMECAMYSKSTRHVPAMSNTAKMHIRNCYNHCSLEFINRGCVVISLIQPSGCTNTLIFDK